jgi:nicotinamidase-related amidase
MTRSSRHPALLRAEDTLLIVVDMQEPFLRNIWERDRVVTNVAALVEATRILRVPILPTQQNTEKMGETIPEIAKLLPSLCVPFDKLCFSGLADGAIASEVSRSGRRQILLCGIESHICINQTAHDLLAAGYQVHVAADAVSSRTESNWAVGLRRMERAGALITSTEAAIYELLGEAGTPEFREILQLVK